jgi:HAE1 family hydrophobic/amphiphilic exporter-1
MLLGKVPPEGLAPTPEGPASDPGEATNSLILAAIENPVTVLVGVLFVVLFGFQALFAVPIQLTPDIERPQISVETRWPGANPQEIEREIVEAQEEALQSLDGLIAMSSQSSPSLGRVTLEMRPGTNLEATLLRVSNKLGEVESYPPEVRKPVITTAGQREGAIAWFILLPLPGRDDLTISHLQEFAEDEIETRLERIPGVAAANLFGGQEREILVSVDPEQVARRGLTLGEIATRLRQENQDISAGHLDEGKRRYTIRTTGAFQGPEGLGDIVLREDLRGRVFLRDVATISLSHKEARVVVRQEGRPCIAINAQRQTGANVLEVMDAIHTTIQELNQGILARKGLEILPAYDSSQYIRGALGTVRTNLLVGSALAVLILLLFLRAWQPTLIISLAIPISAVGTFLAMFLLGRNINVVSLAGLSFAVGMLVDNSIVVLENIFRHTQEGKDRVTASVVGTTEVWGAVLASTLTTIAVFLPLFFLQAEVAQLLRDIAVAICCAVGLSLGVSVLVIPTMAARWMGNQSRDLAGAPYQEGGLSRWIHRLCGSVAARLLVVTSMTLASLLGAWYLMPAAEYLPKGNQNLLFCLLIPPSGYGLPEFNRIADQVEAELSPLWSGDHPKIESFFFVASGSQVFMGAQATDPAQVRELQGPLRASLSKIPGMIAIVLQASIFDQGIGGGRSIDLRFQGPDLARVMGNAGRVFGSIYSELPGSQVHPIPGLSLGQPELQVIPNRERLAEVGLSTQDLGFLVDVLADGARVSEVRLPDGKEIDLTLRGRRDRLQRTQDLATLPIHTPSGRVVPLGTLAKIHSTVGPNQIVHHERRRTVTLRITPPRKIPLQKAMDTLRDKILPPLEKDGSLNQTFTWKMAGTADKLVTTRKALTGNFLIALLVTFLLMASLFESFLYPLVILFSVPLAGLGGLGALALVNAWIAPQPMDVLTMLGFVILLGTVVNNAILLVDRTLRNVRKQGDAPREAVAEAVSARLRPIFMSTMTSIFGMAPLVFMTGPGSELYRGIGSVVLGGLLCSTVFTLVLIPALLSLVLEVRSQIFPRWPI